MKEQQVEPCVSLHNIEFYNFSPRAISHMKCNKHTGLLAIARSV